MAFAPMAASAFFVFGALLVLVGATQAELARGLGLDLAESGMLASAMVLGISVGVFAAGPLVDRLDRRALFCASAGISASALLSVSSAMSFERALAHVLCAGLGGGLYETVLNTETVERYAERSVRAMTWLHAVTTVGAMSAPLLLNAANAAGFATEPATVFHAVGWMHVAVLVLGMTSSFSPPVHRVATARGAVLTPAFVALCVAAFAYIGVESAITAFSIPYATDALGLDEARGRYAISVFWLGLLAGRLVAATRASPDRARPAIAAGSVSAIALVAGVASSWSAVEALAAIVGFSLGGVFPLLVALAGRRTPHATGTAVGLVAGLGSLGGVVVPWLTGVLGDRAGVAIAVGTLSCWCAAVALAALFAERAHRPLETDAGHA